MTEFNYTKEGRRFLIHGDTRCAPKGTLGKYGLGCNFDLDAKIWWTGKEDLAKRAVEVLSEFAAKRAATLATNATYTKLADGTWGVRVPGGLAVGGQVTVRKASGETKQETIGEAVEIIESDDVTIYRIARASRPARQTSTPRRGARFSKYAPHGCCNDCGAALEPWHDGFGIGMCHDCL